MRITGWARRFQDDQARARGDRRFERLGVALVYERHLDAEVAHDAGQKRLRAGVDVILAYDVIAALDERQNRRAHGSHTRRQKQRRLAAFECGNDLRCPGRRRIAVARVKARWARTARSFQEFAGSRRREICGLVNRRNHGVVVSVIPIGIERQRID